MRCLDSCRFLLEIVGAGSLIVLQAVLFLLHIANAQKLTIVNEAISDER